MHFLKPTALPCTRSPITDDLLIFDSPAFPDPNKAGNTLVALQTFTSLRQLDLGVATAAVTAFLKTLNIDVGNSLNTLQERIKLFGTIGLPGKHATIEVPGCSTSSVETGDSSGLPDLGLSISTLSLGNCGSTNELTATADLTSIDKRNIQGTIFSSPNSGFGVISDIDDTVKISNVLDVVASVKTALLDEPKPVPGMPALYTSLANSLKPQFFYVTGSTYQFYPFLNQFLDTTFSTAKGPIFTRNLTIIDPAQLISLITSSTTQEYKVGQIDRLRSMYPSKKWLAIGDSTQKDPEAYAEAFKKGVPIQCTWIRHVEGANNTAERFATAFSGVPATKYRIFTDADIPSLAKINVAGGAC
ncbi:hypothetical protein NLJ89_g10583 [Agrocybe chaxingu]|uniref:Phosphatidate phosphatase APP1 catalytic domain-containing protein n=1 Tax=Agrocybe chaxingu TaxID=84603 RepID=A0A9W8JYD8_9AGAR|nr:hypothetical protein NLJ89_g10583 [Agrocybe chaxingu]